MKKLIFKKHINFDFINLMIRWHLKYYLFKRGTPLAASVYITNACNARCMMCNTWKIRNPSIYPRDAQERAIDALAKAGCYYYSISGGEPTLVKDLTDRLAYAAKKIPYVRLTTNGFSMTPDLAREFAASGIKEIGISIDGTEETHNAIRGKSDAFEKAMNAIDLIGTYAPKVTIIVNSILTLNNIDSLIKLKVQLEAYPFVYHKYLPLVTHELLNTQNDQLMQLPGEAVPIEKLRSFILEEIANPRVVNSAIFLKKVIPFLSDGKDVLSEQKQCLYPYHSIEFDCAGNAYPCITGMSFDNGVPPDADLEKYLNSKEYFNLTKKLKNCQKCKNSMMLCYYEPRLNFPLHNLIRSNLLNRSPF